MKLPPRRRLVLWAVVAAVAIAGALFYRYTWWDLPTGSGPAGPAVPREPFGAPWTTRPVLLLGLGDSITAGFGARPGYSYFDRLARNPPDEFEQMRDLSLSSVVRDLRIENRAVNSSTSEHHLNGQVRALPTQPADVMGIVVLSTGGNDLIHDYGRSPPAECAMYGATADQARPWIESFEQRLATMLDEIAAKFPGGCHIFLANIYDPTDGLGNIDAAGLPAWPDGLEILAAYNDVIRRAADARPNVHLVDLRGAFLGHGINCRKSWTKHYRPEDPHYWYFINLEDPNERGYDAIRRLFLIEMARVFASPIRVAVVTGQDHPAHDWRTSAPALREVLEADPRFQVKIFEDPGWLESDERAGFDVVLLHFMNWERPAPGPKARAGLVRHVEEGKGLFVLHFASGAFDDWPEYRDLVGRVWDKKNTHDPRGPFRVEVLKSDHPIVRGMASFETDDELYIGLTGDRQVEVLATARSKVTGRDHPMAFAFTRGKGRVFHTSLGHDARAIRAAGTAALIRRGCAWVSGR